MEKLNKSKKKFYKNKNKKNEDEYCRKLDNYKSSKFKSNKIEDNEENLEYIFVDKEYIFYTDDESIQNSLSELSSFSDSSEEDLDAIRNLSNDFSGKRNNNNQKLIKPVSLSVIDVLNSQNLIPLRQIPRDEPIEKTYSRTSLPSPMLYNPSSGEMELVSSILSSKNLPNNSFNLKKKNNEFSKSKKSLRREGSHQRDSTSGFKVLLSSSSIKSPNIEVSESNNDQKILSKNINSFRIIHKDNKQEQNKFTEKKSKKKGKINSRKYNDLNREEVGEGSTAIPKIEIKLNPNAHEFRPYL